MPHPNPTAERRRTLLLLLALWALLYLAACVTPPILDDADGTHANAARQMLLSHDWVTLRVNNVRYLEKAPLPYWIVALCLRLFGVTAFAAHLPQALAVLGLALLGYRWAREAYGDRAALYTALFTLTSAGVFLFTRVFLPDPLLALLLAVALYTFLQSLHPSPQQHLQSVHTTPQPCHPDPERVEGEAPASALRSCHPEQSEGPASPNQQSPSTQEAVILSAARSAQSKDPETPDAAPAIPPFQPSTRSSAATALYPYALWTALALAVLTKGLVALVFLFGTAALYLALTGDYRQWRRLRPFTGLALFLAIAAPWHILAGLRNTEGMDGHGFFWFYFINEHVLRFLGRRIPRDYNKLPGYLYWTLHLVWLFPWSLMAGVLLRDAYRGLKRFLETSPLEADQIAYWHPFAVVVVGIALRNVAHIPYLFTVFVAIVLYLLQILRRRQAAAPPHSPLLDTGTPSQRTSLLLTLFSAIVLLFFSLSTNQEYYTLPAYLPLLMLLAAALAHTEQRSPRSAHTSKLTPVQEPGGDSPRRPASPATLIPDPYSLIPDPYSLVPVTLAHAAFTILGAGIAAALAYGLWISRHIPAPPDIGALLAHRGVGDYTLSMSSLFDLTGPSFAALRLPAALALATFAVGPGIAWFLRLHRRHLAATSAIALTAAVFLIAAHIAFARFAPMLSSEDMAQTILHLEHSHAIAPNSTLLLFGDQAYGSSIPFYLNRPLSQPALLVDGRSSSMLFGSTFPDAQSLFLTPQQLLAQWGRGPRKLLFVPIERRADAERLLAPLHPILLKETSGKLLLTDRPLDRRNSP